MQIFENGHGGWRNVSKLVEKRIFKSDQDRMNDLHVLILSSLAERARIRKKKKTVEPVR